MNTTTEIEPKAGDYILVPVPIDQPRLVLLYHFTEDYLTNNIEKVWFYLWMSTGSEVQHTGVFHTYDPKVFEGGYKISEEKAKMIINLWKKRT
jgi:hypothetical protein